MWCELQAVALCLLGFTTCLSVWKRCLFPWLEQGISGAEMGNPTWYTAHLVGIQHSGAHEITTPCVLVYMIPGGDISLCLNLTFLLIPASFFLWHLDNTRVGPSDMDRVPRGTLAPTGITLFLFSSSSFFRQRWWTWMEAKAFTGEVVHVSPEWCASLPAGHTSPGLSDTAGGDQRKKREGGCGGKST